ncbi:MAG: hypothetical protein ABSC37_07760 [Xanthobacteraceae bacterium]
MDRCERKIKDAEYLIPVLRDELKKAAENERTAAIEEGRKSEYAACCALRDAHNKKLLDVGRPAAAALVALAHEDRKLFEIVAKINRNLPAGAEPLSPPGRDVRYSPAISAPRAALTRLGVKMKEVVSKSASTLRHGGPESYEQVEVIDEPVKGLEAFSAGGEPAFDPAPLHLALEIPSLLKGDPQYHVPPHLKF